MIVVGVAGYMLLNNGNNAPEATPTPTPAPNVADATSLQFVANVTSQGQTTAYTWQGENIHGAAMIRVDFSTYSYILDASQEKSWISTDSGATWTASDFATDWIAWSPQWSDYVANLEHWTGSVEYTYTNTVGEAIVLYSIAVNPTIDPATFVAT